MAAKKKTVKSFHENEQLEKRPKTVLGLDVKEVGTAVATAVVAELAQLALKQISKSLDGDSVAETQGSVTNTVSNATEPVRKASAKNPVQVVASAVKETVSGANNGTSEALDDSGNAVMGAVNAAANRGKQFPQDTAKLIEDAVKQAVMSVSNRFDATKQTVADTAGDSARAAKTKLKELKTGDLDFKKSKKEKNKSHKKKKKHKK